MIDINEPVIIAIPPKGGSLKDVLNYFNKLGWIDSVIIKNILNVIDNDKKRIKTEEKILDLLKQTNNVKETVNILLQKEIQKDKSFNKSEFKKQIQNYLKQMKTPDNKYSFSSLEILRKNLDKVDKKIKNNLYIDIDSSRPGRPWRIMFEALKISVDNIPVILKGTEHEIAPTYLRKHKQDISFTCYDAFQNTLMDAVDNKKLSNWKDFNLHLIKNNTDVRILGSLGLKDLLGHFIMFPEKIYNKIKMDKSFKKLTNSKDKLNLFVKLYLKDKQILIDPQYQEVYDGIIDTGKYNIKFIPVTGDIEKECIKQNKFAIYIVRSGSTIIKNNLYIFEHQLLSSETIVAINEERLKHNKNIKTILNKIKIIKNTNDTKIWKKDLVKKLKNNII